MRVLHGYRMRVEMRSRWLDFSFSFMDFLLRVLSFAEFIWFSRLDVESKQQKRRENSNAEKVDCNNGKKQTSIKSNQSLYFYFNLPFLFVCIAFSAPFNGIENESFAWADRNSWHTNVGQISFQLEYLWCDNRSLFWDRIKLVFNAQLFDRNMQKRQPKPLSFRLI